MKSKAQAGFTLIELIVVIVILGILAAVAVPRFLGLESQARAASVRSLGGTLQSAASMAHGICLAQNCVNGNTIVMDGQNIVFTNGYPTNGTVALLVQSSEGFTASGAGQFTKNGSKTALCWVKYTAPAAAGGSPTITYNQGAITSAATEKTVNTDLYTQC
jgi:MSHA pilin protein MshA